MMTDSAPAGYESHGSQQAKRYTTSRPRNRNRRRWDESDFNSKRGEMHMTDRGSSGCFSERFIYNICIYARKICIYGMESAVVSQYMES